MLCGHTPLAQCLYAGGQLYNAVTETHKAIECSSSAKPLRSLAPLFHYLRVIDTCKYNVQNMQDGAAGGSAAVVVAPVVSLHRLLQASGAPAHQPLLLCIQFVAKTFCAPDIINLVSAQVLYYGILLQLR